MTSPKANASPGSGSKLSEEAKAESQATARRAERQRRRFEEIDDEE